MQFPSDLTLPLRRVEKKQATAGTNTTAQIADKPTGAKVIIRRVTVHTDKESQFCRFLAFLSRLAIPQHYIPLYRKIVPDAESYPVELFNGSVEWLDGLNLQLMSRTQEAADTIVYHIFYDVIEPPKKGPYPGWHS